MNIRQFFFNTTPPSVSNESFKRSHLYTCMLTLGIGFIFFLLKFDLSALNFTYVDWIYQIDYDIKTEFLSWEYYRHSPWSFPVVGRMEGYDYPTITGSGMTGMVAFMGLFFKLLSPILPDSFQYFGLWYLACFVLQAYFGLTLFRNLAQNFSFNYHKIDEILVTLFFVTAPPFLMRSGHVNLFSHFFILACLSFYFSTISTKKKLLAYLILSALAASVSQYTTVMVMGLALASFVDAAHRKQYSYFKSIVNAFLVLATVVSVFYVTGDFILPFEVVQNFGFGFYSANVNTFFNPLDHSAFLKPLLTFTVGQYEGFGYFGLGFMGIALTTIVGFLLKKFQTPKKTIHNQDIDTKTEANPSKSTLYPLVYMTLLFLIYSFSYKIGFNDKLIYNWHYGALGTQIFESLRASGRFIWIPFYVSMALIWVLFFKKVKGNVARSILILSLLTLQLYDIQSLLSIQKELFKPCPSCGYTLWRPLFKESSRVIVFPSHAWHILHKDDFFIFARAAVAEKKAINTGYFARRHNKVLKDYERKIYAEWEHNDLGENDKAIFVGNKSKAWRFRKLVACGKVIPYEYEDYALFIPPSLTQTLEYIKNTPNIKKWDFDTEGVGDFIKKYKNNTILVTAKEEATDKLDSLAKAAFVETGAVEFKNLGFAGAYYSIIHKGKTIVEKVDNRNIIEKSWSVAELLKMMPEAKPKPITLRSLGAYMGKDSKIMVGDKNFSPDARGLNFVVLSDNFEVITTAYFDTYEESYRAIVK